MGMGITLYYLTVLLFDIMSHKRYGSISQNTII